MKSREPSINFAVTWVPFFLAPELSKSGVNKMERYEAKFGAARVAGMIPYMQSVGRAEGINFSYGGLIANTMSSHRLMEWAGRQGAGQQNDLVEQLFHQYFEAEGNLGDDEVLLRAVGDAGLDVDSARALLATDDLTAEVLAEARQVSAQGIRGVPHMIVDGRYSISGAQESDTLQKLFTKIAKSNA